MTKKKQSAKVEVAEVRAWFRDVLRGSYFTQSYSIPRKRLSYACDYHIAAFSKVDIGAVEGGPANKCRNFWRHVKRACRPNTVDFRALQRFAATRSKRPEPVKLFGVCVDRRGLNRLLQRAPAEARVTVSIGDSETDVIEIRATNWFAYIMPYLAEGRMPRFSRTVKP